MPADSQPVAGCSGSQPECPFAVLDEGHLARKLGDMEPFLERSVSAAHHEHGLLVKFLSHLIEEGVLKEDVFQQMDAGAKEFATANEDILEFQTRFINASH